MSEGQSYGRTATSRENIWAQRYKSRPMWVNLFLYSVCIFKVAFGWQKYLVQINPVFVRHFPEIRFQSSTVMPLWLGLGFILFHSLSAQPCWQTTADACLKKLLPLYTLCTFIVTYEKLPCEGGGGGKKSEER